MPNFVEIEKTFCGRTDVHNYGQAGGRILRRASLGRLESRPNNQNKNNAKAQAIQNDKCFTYTTRKPS